MFDAELSDEQLMLQYVKGEARAFDVLYQRHRPKLFRFFTRETASAALGEELYQETWLRLIRGRERYQVSAKFSTYLYTVAHSVLIDHFRKTNRIGQFETATDTLPDIEACALTNPDESWGNALTAKRLTDCLNTLPVDQREAFLLKEEAGLSLSDIAAAMSCGVEAAKSRIRYALKRLRVCLGEIA